MQNYVLPSILSSSEIAEILNQSDVITNREKLSTQNVVKFAITLPSLIKTKLQNSLSINLSHLSTIPMRWIIGNTSPHIDKGDSNFNTSYLIYLTDSIGTLIIDEINYSIVAGNAHIFSEGLEHSTINTENNMRLMIGPISENGIGVGGPTVIYFDNEAQDNILNNGFYVVESVNGISSWTILSSSNGNNLNSPNGGPYNAGDVLYSNPGQNVFPMYILYPYIAPPAPLSNICFVGSTPITTNQGNIPIDKINPQIHTIRNKKILRITQTTTQDKYLICFEKDSLAPNIPSQKTIISSLHCIYYQGKMMQARDFVGKYENVKNIRYRGETLYNVLMEDHEKMLVNNLICETLNPKNAIVEVYKFIDKLNPKEQESFIKANNKYVIDNKVFI